MATRRNSPSRIDSSRLLCTLRMYQSILSDFGFLDRRGRLPRRRPPAVDGLGRAAPRPAALPRRAARPPPGSRPPDFSRRGCAAGGAASTAGAAVGSAGSGSRGRQLSQPPASLGTTLASGGNSAAGCPFAMFRSSVTPRFLEDVQHSPEQHSQKKSYPARMIAKAKIRISTTIEARNNSVRVGQETLFISASTAIRKSANAGTLTTRYDTHTPTASNTPGNHK